MVTVPKAARRVGMLVVLATVVAALALWASPAQAAGTPSAVPNLVSTTHPDPSAWYPLADPVFTWGAASESGGTIAGYSFSFDQNPNTVPPVLSGAALSYQTRVNYTVGSDPAEIRVADLNGDGKLDLVVENSGSNTVSVLMGNGDGTFKPAVNYATGADPWSLQIGDVNGDGKLDIVTCNESANTVSVLLGNGDGTFKPAVNYTTGAGTSPECMRLGDLTGDGKLDIITANAGTNNISVLRNNGDGTFAAPVMYSTATHPTSIAIGDLNGDGKQDVVTANYATNNVSVLMGNGDGTFQPAVNYACGTEPQTVELADCNNDGHLDIVTANYDGTASVLLNKGDGTFATHVDYATGAGPYSLSLADLNHDGNVDIVTVNHTANTVSVLLGNGDGTFQTHTDYSTGNGPFWCALGDFNGDGYGDIAVSNYSDGTVSVLLGSGYYRSASGKLSASFSGVHDGTWYLHVRAVDSSGVAGPTSSCQVNIDTVAPTTTATGLQSSTSTGWTNAAQTVTLTATDATSGVAATYYTIDGTQYTYNGSFQVSGAGSHTITYWSVDKAGNTETAHTGYVNIDTAAPVTTATTDPSGWTNGPIQVTLSASDTGGSGLATTYYQIGSGTPQTYSGPFTVSTATPIAYWSTDNAGNTETANTLTPQIDTIAPVTTATTDPSGWTNGSVQVTLSATDQGGSGLAATYYQIGDGEVQTYSAPFTVTDATPIAYWSTDNAGNEETHHTLTPQIDLIAPVTAASLDPSGWTSGPVTVTLSATDQGGSGVDATYYQVGDGPVKTYSAPFTVTDATTVTYWSTDNAGNVEAQNLVATQIETIPPVTAASLDPSGWTNGPVTVTLSATDQGGSGLAATYYQIGDGEVQTYSAPFTVTDATPIAYWSTDNAGNTETANTLTPQIDTVAPTVSDDVPIGWQNTAQKVTISASDQGGSGLAALTCTLDGVDQQLPAAGGSFTVSGQGVHTIVYSATDNAGNQSAPVTRELRIDTTAPATTATTDPSGWTRGPVQVTLSATDHGGSGLAATYYQVGDGDIQTYSAPFTVTDATPVTYWSTDNAGNEERHQTLTPQIDTVAPVTTSADLAAAAGTAWQSGPVQVALDATDDGGSGVAKTYYQVDGQGMQLYQDAFQVSGDGSHEVDYYSVDEVGNIETTEVGWVNIDSTPPTIDVSGLQPTADSGWQTTDQQVTLDASDAGSGLAAVTYSIDGIAQPDYTQPFTVSGDGSHIVAYSAVDNAGNVASGYGYVNIDTTPPQTTATDQTTKTDLASAPDIDFVLDAQQVSLTATDAGSGVAHTYYTLDGGPQTEYTEPFTVAGVGSHAITYWSIDALGNREDAQTGYVNIAPAEALLTLASGLAANDHSGWTATPVAVTLTANDAAQQDGTYSVVTHYRIDGGTWQTYSAPFTISASGSHRVDYYSSDSLGTTEQTDTGYVNIDTTPPVTVASGPTTPQRTTTVVKLSASDAQSGVASTFYRIDAQAPQSGTTVIIPAPANHSNDGVHTISYYSVDEAGNVETAHVFTVRIDTIRPVFTYRGAKSFTAHKNGVLKLKLRARDAGGTCTLVVKLTRKVGKRAMAYQRTVLTRHTSKWQTVKLALRGLPRGKYTVVLRLSDPAGNLSAAKTIRVTIS